MLELRNASKRFSGIPAVDDPSFCARRGEVTGYLGLAVEQDAGAISRQIADLIRA
jgi:ABC-type Na+ transport system ATPase subunit NatA